MVHFFFLGLVERLVDIAPLTLVFLDPTPLADFLDLRGFFDVSLRAITYLNFLVVFFFFFAAFALAIPVIFDFLEGRPRLLPYVPGPIGIIYGLSF